MKSLQQFLEAHNFLVKGHTIKQDAGYVDLDLPSGAKWATCNIGANKPEDYGLLFQWGRIDGYKYDNNNHKFLSKNNYVTTSGTKYKEGDILKPEDDAAYQATKGIFRMPTKDEIDELSEYTDNEWVELNGVKGRKFISKKDKSKWIFIPAAGYFFGYDGKFGKFHDSGSNGHLWASSANASSLGSADCLYFDFGDCYRSHNYRGNGRSVRGVCK